MTGYALLYNLAALASFAGWVTAGTREGRVRICGWVLVLAAWATITVGLLAEGRATWPTSLLAAMAAVVVITYRVRAGDVHHRPRLR